jgi:hypothetical protein
MTTVRPGRAGMALSNQDTDRLTPSVVVPLGGPLSVAAPVADLIAGLAERYPNPKTRHQYVAELGDLFRVTGRRHPSELTDAEVFRWCTGLGRQVGNNTVRNRLSRVTESALVALSLRTTAPTTRTARRPL